MVQEAWSAGELARLRPLMTPEMLGYFSEELTRNASQGVRNIVSDVELLKGELTESWEEGDLQYATAYLRWRAIDYLVRLGRSPRPRLAGQRRPAQPGRGRRDVDLRPPPRRRLAALRHPADLTGRPNRRFSRNRQLRLNNSNRRALFLLRFRRKAPSYSPR